MSAHHHPHASPLGKLGYDEILAELRKRGMRITKNRESILRVMLSTTSPLSLEQIQVKAREFGEAPDYTTVFRTMLQLEEMGIAQRANISQSCAFYELVDPDHHVDHIVCTACGIVTAIADECPVEKAEKEIAKKYGYGDVTHVLEFYGTCPDCVQKRETPASSV